MPDIDNTLFGNVSQLINTSKYYFMAHRRRAKAHNQAGLQWNIYCLCVLISFLLHVFYISLIISLLDDRAKILLKYPWYRLLIIQSYLMF